MAVWLLCSVQAFLMQLLWLVLVLPSSFQSLHCVQDRVQLQWFLVM